MVQGRRGLEISRVVLKGSVFKDTILRIKMFVLADDSIRMKRKLNTFIMLEKIIANLERTIKNGGKLEVITVLKRKLKELKKNRKHEL